MLYRNEITNKNEDITKIILRRIRQVTLYSLYYAAIQEAIITKRGFIVVYKP